jgi:hypothetical protein
MPFPISDVIGPECLAYRAVACSLGPPFGDDCNRYAELEALQPG